jgi:hypothetical protein
MFSCRDERIMGKPIPPVGGANDHGSPQGSSATNTAHPETAAITIAEITLRRLIFV